MLLVEILLTEMSLADARMLIKRYEPDFPFNNPTPDIISRVRRKIAKFIHPDRGGSENEMKMVNDALDTIENAIGIPLQYQTTRDEYDKKQYQREYQRTRHEDEPTGGKTSKQSYPFEKGPNTPVWAWAGYSGGLPPEGRISREALSDINFLKKKAWEVSGKPKPLKRNEYTFQNFDGRFGRGIFTVFASKDKFAEIAEWMPIWDNFFDSKAVIVSHGRHSKTLRVYPVFNKKIMKNKAFEIVRPGNGNPLNYQSFVNELLRRLPS